MDEDGAVMWSAGLNRTIRLSTTTREDAILFLPDERIYVYTFTGHSGFAVGRNHMAFQDEFARSIPNHEPTPTGYAGVALAYVSLIPQSTVGVTYSGCGRAVARATRNDMPTRFVTKSNTTRWRDSAHKQDVGVWRR